MTVRKSYFILWSHLEHLIGSEGSEFLIDTPATLDRDIFGKTAGLLMYLLLVSRFEHFEPVRSVRMKVYSLLLVVKKIRRLSSSRLTDVGPSTSSITIWSPPSIIYSHLPGSRCLHCNHVKSILFINRVPNQRCRKVEK
jgi:hypothetical protein